MDQNWGNWDKVTLEDHGVAIGNWSQQPSTFTDGNYIYQVSPGLHQKTEEWNKLRVYSFDDGSVVMDKMMHEWYMPDDSNPDKFINGAFHHMYSRTPYNWFLLSHTDCMHEMINTSRLIVDSNDETDMIRFRNSNGDYFMDSAYSPTVVPHWYCLSFDKTVSMRRDSIAIDRNGFNVIGVSYLGLMSFGVSTQDGTAIGMMQFADETVSDDKNLKGGGLLVDNGGAFDGLYFCSPLLADGTGGWSGPTAGQTHFVASDSFHGIITNKPAGPYVIVISPGGGERLLPGKDYEIKWESYSSVLKVKIEYSVNNGSTWSTVAESTDSDGSYIWNVPDVMSSNCLIKISDISDSLIKDVSDNVFAIGKTITVISPNGGEKLASKGSKDISWTSEGVVNVKIEYSTDTGSTWSIITESAQSNGTYTWQLPDLVSSTCLIKITDNEDADVNDISNKTFSILTTSIKILSPNGGEEWTVRQNYNIKWSSFNVTKAKIEISYNNGLTWNTIKTGITASSGTYLWKVTGKPSSQCLLKISDEINPGISDISDSDFSTLPAKSLWAAYTILDGTLTDGLYKGVSAITADPEGGLWCGSGKKYLSYFNGYSWSSFGNDSMNGDGLSGLAFDKNGKIWYTTNYIYNNLYTFDGVNFQNVTGCPNGSKDIVIDKNGIVWVNSYQNGLFNFDGTTWKSYPGILNTTLEDLCLDYDNSIWIAYYPNRGVSHFDGTTWTHYYESSGLSSNYVRAITVDKQGRKWFATEDGVSSFDGTKWSKYSDAEGFSSGNCYSIAVDLEGIVWIGSNGGVTSFDGKSWTLYTSSNSGLPDNMVYDIAVDNDNVKWFATNGGLVSFAYHAGSFIILTSPNGGELWQTGSTHEITWHSKEVEKINIEYSPDNGATWNIIASSVDASSQSYLWTLPSKVTANCKIRITSTSDSSVKDESNVAFTIADPFVRFVYPNGGEKLAIGSVQTVKWLSVGVSKVKIEFSIDDGFTWLSLTTMDASAGSVSWTVPNFESVKCLMRIADDSDPEKIDFTDSDFTIVKSYITVLSPNGGEEWPRTSTNSIKWVSDGVEEVKIEYSVDNGISWNLIENNIAAESISYNWTLPATLSFLCRMRISEQNRAEINDISDTPFFIIQGTTEVKKDVPKEFTVSQNMPNPFNPSTTVNFSIPASERVKVDIYNLSGQKVSTLADNYMSAGRYSLTWNAAGFSAGIYICRVSYGSVTKTVKMAFVK